MRAGGEDIVPTQSAMLELVDEHKLLVDGQEFLDQKRMLLAGETMRWLARYDEVAERLETAQQAARVALAEAVARHGLGELEAYAASVPHGIAVTETSSSFLGVALAELHCDVSDAAQTTARNPSPELARCVLRFRKLIVEAVTAAGLVSSLHRLEAEYRRTERRARALEDVLMPEVRDAMKTIGDRLEEYDQEEAIRVRLRTGPNQ